MTFGGPLGLAGEGSRPGEPGPGCRAITLQRATELWGFYTLKGRDCRDRAARRHCTTCAEELLEAIVEVSRWRRAA
jgi:hypothetical protein